MTIFYRNLFTFLAVCTWCLTQAKASDLYETVTRFEEDKGVLMRKYSVRESEEYYERFQSFYSDWLKELNRIDFEALSQEGKVDYLMLKNKIEKNAYFLQQDYDAYKEVRYVADFATPLYAFIKTRRIGTEPEAKDVAATFYQAIGEVNKAIQETDMATPFDSWQKADKAADVIMSLQRNLQESFQFYYGYDPDFTWWVQKPYDSLATVLVSYADVLRQHYKNTVVKDDGSGIIGKPIRRDAIIKRLQGEFIPYTPEELIAMAESQFKWCEQEMLKASEALGYGKDWKKALEHVKNSYVAPGKQPELIYKLAKEAEDYVESNDLITVPPLAKEVWRMEMMTPERQEINPFFTGGEVISISYPTNTMDHDDKMMSMRGNNPHFSRATVHHELIPGHHLQMYMMSRYHPYRQVFMTPFWVEGWTLYWEINLWEKGFAQSPEDKIGMLFWRMHRCARIIFSLKYHLGEMTPQECIDMLVDRVGHEYANAKAEVRRSFVGDYGPLYQIAYMIGGMQFYALRQELMDKEGWTEKQFHDSVMKEGSIPVAMLRAIFTREKLKKNEKAHWRFAEDISFK